MAEDKKKEEVKLTPEQQEEQNRQKMYKFLLETFGSTAPTAEKVTEWKGKYGRVRVLPLSDDEVYFIRPIKRIEYKALLATAQTSGGDDPETFLKETLVTRCLLWPVMDTAQFNDSLGGTIEALYTIVMDASNFVSQDVLFTIARDL